MVDEEVWEDADLGRLGGELTRATALRELLAARDCVDDAVVIPDATLLLALERGRVTELALAQAFDCDLKSECSSWGTASNEKMILPETTKLFCANGFSSSDMRPRVICQHLD